MKKVPGIDKDRLKRITQTIINLPTLPTVVAKMIELIDDPKSSARSLSRLVKTDQVLTARILKLANSAYYGFPNPICSINLAIVVLGFETIKNLGLSVAVISRFARAFRLHPFLGTCGGRGHSHEDAGPHARLSGKRERSFCRRPDPRYR
jgi:hypothetical protein